MKEKIFQMLKTKYAALGLSEEVLQAHAELLDSMGIVTEENLESKIDDQKSFLTKLQKENDRRATDAAKKAKDAAKSEFENASKKKAEEDAKAEAEKKAAEEEVARKKAEEDEKNKHADEPEKTEDMLKRLLDEKLSAILEPMKKDKEASERTMKELYEKVSKSEQEKAMAEKNAALISKAKELGIPESYNEFIIPATKGYEKIEDAESFMKNFKQRLTDDHLESMTPPETAEQKVEKEGEEIASLIEKGTEELMKK